MKCFIQNVYFLICSLYLLLFIFRLTPSYMFAILFLTKLQPFFGDGPLWFIIRKQTLACSDYWWTNLLYINNLHPETPDKVTKCTRRQKKFEYSKHPAKVIKHTLRNHTYCPYIHPYLCPESLHTSQEYITQKARICLVRAILAFNYISGTHIITFVAKCM